MNDLINVLHLSGASLWGGSEQQLVNLIHRFQKANETENYIFCFQGSRLEEYSIDQKIPFISTKKTKPFSSSLLKLLAKSIKDHQIDVLHVHTANFLTTVMLADIFFNLRTPIIFSKKGISDRSSFLSTIKYNFRGIDKIICVSEAVKASFGKILKPHNHTKMAVVHDGVEVIDGDLKGAASLRETFKLPENKFLIGNIANHSDAKDLGTFIKTVNYLINGLGRTDLHFIQIGKELGPTKGFIGLVDEYNLKDNITFTGVMDNAKLLIPQFDVFLMTSKLEGGPSSILDAFNARVPVVITNVGMVPQAIQSGKNGFICKVGDFECLANAVNDLINDGDLRNKFIDNGYSILKEQFSIDITARKTLALYREVLKKDII